MTEQIPKQDDASFFKCVNFINEKCICNRLNTFEKQEKISGYLIDITLKRHASATPDIALEINGRKSEYYMLCYDYVNKSLKTAMEDFPLIPNEIYYCRHNIATLTTEQIKDLYYLCTSKVEHKVVVQYLIECCGFDYSSKLLSGGVGRNKLFSPP